MEESSPVVEGLLMIHKIITRGLGNSIRKCDEYLSDSGISGKEAGGFSMYVSTLKWVMHSHHTTEDELGFPYFRQHIEAPYDRLKEDHLSIAGMLQKLVKPVPGTSREELSSLRETLGEIETLWAPHIQIEEEKFSNEKVNSLFGMGEQVKLAALLGKHSSNNSGPGQFALPFMFFNLGKNDREIFMKNFPWIVRNVLVPVVWIGQWKPMEPFFLS
jgi:hypothetical protein